MWFYQKADYANQVICTQVKFTQVNAEQVCTHFTLMDGDVNYLSTLL